ncbi:MAG: hypothetical protein VKO21_05370, partial [Candidatus Sericytochromatia bacterium]|nr:hypothetical protein [Candidatus Sericytochromatia bacterium]
PLPPGVVPYALAVAPDGGWLVADHPGRRVLHRPPAGDWSILPWVVDHPRVLATGVDGVVHVLGRKGPGLDVLQRFRWLPPFLPAESTGETVATGDIDAMTIHPVSGVLWSESGRVRDQTGRLWLELPPGSRVESMASGRGGLAVAGAGQIWIMKPDETVWKVVNRSVERLPSTALRALAWDATQLLLAEHARGRVWSWTEEASFRLLAGALDVQVKDPLPVQGEIPALSADIGAPTALLPLGGGRILLADALSASLLEWQP